LNRIAILSIAVLLGLAVSASAQAADDVGVQTINVPTALCVGNYTFDADVTNFGTNPAVGVAVTLLVDGNLVSTELVANIAAGATQNVVFSAPAALVTPGASMVTVITTAAPDSNPANDLLTATVNVLGVIPVPVSGFTEDFETGQGGWAIGGGTTSFAFGTPGGLFSGAASGVNAFATGNLGGTYLANENGFVKSPCYDFSALGNPVVSLSIWWDSEFSWDGANLQSSVDGGATWVNVGTFGAPDNWYNDNTINGNPGGSMEGWSGNGATASGGWVTAISGVPALAGATNVEFRVNFGSDASVQLTGGVAFDDFTISDTVADDVGVVAINGAASAVCVGSYNINADIRNFGANPASNVAVTLLVSGAVVVTETVAALPAGQTQNVAFSVPAALTTPGAQTLDVIVTASPDLNPSNDFASTPVNVLGVIPVPSSGILEDFETGQAGWSVNGSNTTWAFGTPGGVFAGAASGTNAFATGNLGGIYNNNEDGFIKSPCYDLSALSNPFVRLNVWWDSEFSWDGGNVQYSTDGGATWVTIGAFGDPNNWYNDNTINGAPGGSQEGWTGQGATPGSGGYLSATNAAPALAGATNVEFRVTFGSDGSVTPSGGIAFDDFEIFEPTQPFPGSGEDLTLGIDINGVAATTPFNSFATATVGDSIDIVTQSPGGTYVGLPYALVADLFTTGGPNPTPIGGAAFPEAHISANAIVLLDGAAPAAGLNWVIGPVTGSTATFAVLDPVFIGNSVLLQSLVLDNLANNGFFAITNGLVVDFQ
jgi:CARDB